MLITFKSRADGDVIMFHDVAKHILGILGKDSEDTHGIVTVEQIPAAIEALKAAVAHEKQNAAPAEPQQEDDWKSDPAEAKAATPPVSLAQRVTPLLTMFGYSLKAGTPVTWEG